MLATEAVAFPSSNATHATGGVAVNTANPIRDSGQVLTIPLKRVNHRGITTPSILKRFFKTEVFGVYGAAYLAECNDSNTLPIPILLSLAYLFDLPSFFTTRWHIFSNSRIRNERSERTENRALRANKILKS